MITGSDSKVRGAVLKMGRTGTVIRRPVSKLYPFVQRSVPNEGNNGTTEKIIHVGPLSDVANSIPTLQNGETNVVDRNVIRIDDVVNPAHNTAGGRVRREAAVVGELRRKFGNS